MRLRILAMVATMMWVAACSPARQHPRSNAATDASWAAARGSVLYASYCGGCHGPRGHGDGPVAAVLDLKPTDLRTPGLLAHASDRELVDRMLHGTPLAASPGRSAVAEDIEVEAIRAYVATLPGSDWELLRVGRIVFEGACAPCHGAYGQGEGVLGATNEPPPANLMKARERYTDPALGRIAAEGVGTMPPLADAFHPGELRAVIAYVRHLSKGYRLYDTYCASCHGDDGRGVHPEDQLAPSMPAPPLDAAALARLGPKAERAKILHMLRRESGRMPHFRETLTEAQLLDVVAYLRASGS